MAEQERVDAPDTDQIPVQTATARPTQPAQRESAQGDVAQREPAQGDLAQGDLAQGEPAPYEPNTGMPDPAVVPTPDHAFKKMRRTRFSGLWIGLTAAAVVLLVLLVFIIENSQSVNISFFGAHGRLPLGVALLLAAIAGVLLVAVPGYGRILQLRRALRRSATK